MSIRYKDSEGNWVTGNKAIETTIVDSEGNFESSNVEGALRELAEKTKSNSDVASIEAAVKSNTTKITKLQSQVSTNATDIDNLQSDMTTAKEDIEYLKVNGGGGGGSHP